MGPGACDPSSVNLAALCAGLAHGSVLEMSLAAECAALLGRPPWLPRQSVHVHRLVGCPAARSAAGRGVLIPLHQRERTMAEALLLGVSSASLDHARARGRSALALPTSLDALFDTTPGCTFTAYTALLDAALPSPDAPGAPEGEYRAARVRHVEARPTAAPDDADAAAIGDAKGTVPDAVPDAARESGSNRRVLRADQAGGSGATCVKGGSTSCGTGGSTSGGSTSGGSTSGGLRSGAAAVAAEQGDQLLASGLRRAGVKLLLVSGAADDSVRSCCEVAGVLPLHGVQPWALRALCDGSGTTPLLDARALGQLPSTRAVDDPSGLSGEAWPSPTACEGGMAVLEGRLLQAGVLPAEEADIKPLKGEKPSAADSPEDCYLLLRATPRAATEARRQRPSGQAGATNPEHGAANSSGGAAVLLCGITADLAAEGESRFWGCLHRVRAALEARAVLPGAGACELACAAMLERDVAEGWSTAAATGVAAGQDGELSGALRAEAAQCVADALVKLVRIALLNSGATAATAAERIATSLEAWRTLPASEMQSAMRGGGSMRTQWSEPRWAPLAESAVEDGSGSQGGSEARLPAGGPVFDELTSKVAALHASIDVLHQALLSDAMLTTVGPGSS